MKSNGSGINAKCIFYLSSYLNLFASPSAATLIIAGLGELRND